MDKLEFINKTTSVSAQKIDKSNVKTYNMVLIEFLLSNSLDSLKKICC